ncbi:MAG: DUF1616 domain-containing protein [Candidatus Bathyarchaeota archaeon]|nr:DUF1616 domain-containing protein [Candidatus Bathyarchaeota archaeon]
MAVGLIGTLLIAALPVISVISFPNGESFSELYLLGPEQLAQNYPSNITIGQNYMIYANVVNHLKSAGYYVLYVKFQNGTALLPDIVNKTPSQVAPVLEYRFLIPDGGKWSSPFTFSVSNASIAGNQSIVNRLTINGLTFNVDVPSVWDTNSTSFPHRLIFELWLYNSSSGYVQYHNRYVDLKLNLIKELAET